MEKSVPICENCGRPIPSLFMSRQRFCCRACSDQWFQEERRQALDWFRAMGMRVETHATEQELMTKSGAEQQR